MFFDATSASDTAIHITFGSGIAAIFAKMGLDWFRESKSSKNGNGGASEAYWASMRANITEPIIRALEKQSQDLRDIQIQLATQEGRLQAQASLTAKAGRI